MFDSLTPAPPQVRATQRRVLLALFLAALGLTAAKFYLDRSRSADRPLEWQEDVVAATIEADLKDGQSYLLLVAPADDPVTQDWLDALETPGIRQQIRWLNLKTVRVDWPPEEQDSQQPSSDSGTESEEDRATRFGKWPITKTPVVLVLLAPNETPKRLESPDREAIESYLQEARTAPDGVNGAD